MVLGAGHSAGDGSQRCHSSVSSNPTEEGTKIIWDYLISDTSDTHAACTNFTDIFLDIASHAEQKFKQQRNKVNNLKKTGKKGFLLQH